jgi:hypothetical protein
MYNDTSRPDQRRAVAAVLDAIEDPTMWSSDKRSEIAVALRLADMWASAKPGSTEQNERFFSNLALRVPDPDVWHLCGGFLWRSRRATGLALLGQAYQSYPTFVAYARDYAFALLEARQFDKACEVAELLELERPDDPIVIELRRIVCSPSARV